MFFLCYFYVSKFPVNCFHSSHVFNFYLSCSLLVNHLRRGGKDFIDSLLPRLKSENSNGVLSMPFVLEVSFQNPGFWRCNHTDTKACSFIIDYMLFT